jgi:hypothetical protein
MKSVSHEQNNCHNPNCPYCGKNVPMQYALYKVGYDKDTNKPVEFIVDANEVNFIADGIEAIQSNEKPPEIIRELSENGKTVIAYGCIYARTGSGDDVKFAEDCVTKIKNMQTACLQPYDKLVYISGIYECELLDINCFGHRTVAVLLTTDLDFDELKELGCAYTLFPKQEHNGESLSILECIFNRGFLLALKGIEENYDDSDRENWKQYISRENAGRVSDSVYEVNYKK